MPLQATSGAASYDAFGGGVAAVPNYIEDVFSTWLYTGNGSYQTVNTGINLAADGGMLWLKSRSAAADHALFDTARGFVNSSGFTEPVLNTNNTNAQSFVNYLAPNPGGFALDGSTIVNTNGTTYASWTFRKQPKFFDVVTYTGNGANRNIAHNLGSVPGCIIIKRTDTSDNWVVYHRSLGNDYQLFLNLTLAQNYTNEFNFTTPTSTVFSVNGNDAVNASGGTYVAYLFAHNAGGFGLTGTDNVISCGSFTTDGSGNATVDLGYEPQWVLLKSSSGTGNWIMEDNMRGWTVNPTGFTQRLLFANLSNAESAGSNSATLTSTGFTASGNLGSSNTYIYIAIRRGPMRTPTSGTSVFDPEVATDTEGQGVVKTTNFPVDLQITKSRASSGSNFTVDRLRGVSTTATDTGPSVLITNSTDAQSSGTFAITRAWNNTGFQISGAIGNSSQVYWNFRRAPGFFDEVCYTGDATSSRAITHNLGVAPEFVILKRRDSTGGWATGESFTASQYGNMYLEQNGNESVVAYSSNWYFKAQPTATTFTIGTGGDYNMNASGGTYVAYLFASCPGVSRVGSYTGNGSSQTINCGFTGGARFVMVKRTDSTGNWWVFDTARGMTTGTDPRLALNSTAAELNNDWINTVSTGFQIVTADASVNASGGTYIYLSIA